jgi:hypothetical protein
MTGPGRPLAPEQELIRQAVSVEAARHDSVGSVLRR